MRQFLALVGLLALVSACTLPDANNIYPDDDDDSASEEEE